MVLSSVDEDKSILHLPAFYHPPIAFFPPFPEQSPCRYLPQVAELEGSVLPLTISR